MNKIQSDMFNLVTTAMLLVLMFSLCSCMRETVHVAYSNTDVSSTN